MRKKLFLIVIIILASGTSALADESEYLKDDNTSIAPSIYYCVDKEVPLWTGYLPDSIWVTRGSYGGYVYKQYYEKTRYDTFLAKYCGHLYYNVVPLKIKEAE